MHDEVLTQRFTAHTIKGSPNPSLKKQLQCRFGDQKAQKMVIRGVVEASTLLVYRSSVPNTNEKKPKTE